jgi:hypothetical protein
MRSLAFREVWAVYFEFQAPNGERPSPVCLVAIEARTGKTIRLWRDDLLRLERAPIDTGPDSLFAAFYASAELGCFLALGWPMPINVLDLYVESRAQFNGTPSIDRRSLVDVLTAHGLGHIDAGEKDAMRRLVIERSAWSAEEQVAILDYCQSDVDATVRLLPKMAQAGTDLPRALYRGGYMTAVARMEWNGIPVDAEIYGKLRDQWDDIQLKLIAAVDADYGVYEGKSFRSTKFQQYLSRNNIAWPNRPDGKPALDRDTFRLQAGVYPVLEPLRQLRTTLSELRLNKLAIGSDGRNRYLLSPFAAATGRNQPSNSKSIFGPSRWLRGLIKPPEGYGFGYIDWTSQEIAIAAGLSGDDRMMEGYNSGDPYLSFAIASGLAPPGATNESHKAERDPCKSIVLGILYGMGDYGLAARIDVPRIKAREFLDVHERTYPKFWKWSRSVVDHAMLHNEIQSVWGWSQKVGKDPNPRALMNFPMQANGSEMLRLAAIAATEAGIEVCAPVHDALAICSPLDRLDVDIATMRAIMTKAGEKVTGGLPVKTDVEIVRWPDRYMDPRGRKMWDLVTGLVDGQNPDPTENGKVCYRMKEPVLST